MNKNSNQLNLHTKSESNFSKALSSDKDPGAKTDIKIIEGKLLLENDSGKKSRANQKLTRFPSNFIKRHSKPNLPNINEIQDFAKNQNAKLRVIDSRESCKDIDKIMTIKRTQSEWTSKNQP